MEPYRFTLYVAGESPRSERVRQNLAAIAAAHLGDDFSITTVDVLSDPEAAELNHILTTPTVVRTSPSPPRRVTGDLSDAPRVLSALDLPYPVPGVRT